MVANSDSARRQSIPAPASGINCFGCAPTNQIGLGLQFIQFGNSYESWFALGADYESYPGVVHGGIVATVVDEIMSQAVYRDCGTSVYTIGLRVRYGQPMRTDVKHRATAQVTRSDNEVIVADSRIEAASGELVAAATGTFHRIPEDEIASLRSRLEKLQQAAAGRSSLQRR